MGGVILLLLSLSSILYFNKLNKIMMTYGFMSETIKKSDYCSFSLIL